MEINEVKKDEQGFQYQKGESASCGSKYREVLSIIVQNPPKEILIGEWNEKGDLNFSINLTDIGLTYRDYKLYDDEVFSYFVVDFMGELIIRENLQLFADKLQEYDINDYMISLQEQGTHKRFGVRTHQGKLIFKFHASLLKNILTEDLREQLGEYIAL